MIIEWEKEDTIAMITLNNGENRHNPQFIRAILDALAEIEKDESIYAVVITSSDEKSWSQGIDLPWIMNVHENREFQTIKAFLCSLNVMFKKILLFPMPVIASINGHAAGNGGILACCCDFRLMKADRGYFFLPGVDINISYLPGILEIIKRAFPYYKLEEAVLTGKRYGAKELEEHHVIMKACDNAEAVLRESIAFAKTFKKKRGIFREMKRRFNKNIIAAIDNEDPEYIEGLNIFKQ
jgi:enoyl-CoA hydratase/carnithine racemase